MRRALVGLVLGLLAGLPSSGLAAAVPGTAVYRPAAKALAAFARSEVSLPAGAAKVKRDPSASSSLGKRPLYRTGMHYELVAPYAVDDHGFWQASESPAGVVAWIKAHPPAGSTGLQIRRGSGSPGSTLVFRFGSYPAQVVQRALVYEVTTASGGASAVRADGIAEWLPAHPRWDRIPARARVLTATITLRRINGPRHSRSATFTSAGKLSPIAQAVNRARAIPPRPPPPCVPQFTAETFRLSFRARRGGRVLARATGSFGCAGGMVVTVGGRGGPYLQLPQLISRLATLVWGQHPR